ncbi:MAG: hypothetical protein HYR96_13320 [Deltaproteobacteria bacterium]|nr:hypothetical protein [Deltaproteobacteria bacterium]MBI3293765.1 hypothetical protein [Deltaproteobacteria bacterium]
MGFLAFLSSFLFLITHCAKQPDHATTPQDTLASLQGIWESPCIEDDTGHFKIALAVNGKIFTYTDNNYFSSEGCNGTPAPSVDSEGTFELSDSSLPKGIPAGTVGINWTATGPIDSLKGTTYDILLLSENGTKAQFGASAGKKATDRPATLGTITFSKK